MANHSPSLLAGAATRVAAFMETLDNSHTVCPECERPHYNNWSEHNAYQELEAVMRKLHKFENLFRLSDVTRRS